MIYVRKEENLGRENSRKSDVSTIQEYKTMNCMVKKRGEESKGITTGGKITENWRNTHTLNQIFLKLLNETNETKDSRMDQIKLVEDSL